MYLRHVPQTCTGMCMVCACRAFEVEYEYYGVMKREELLPGGSKTPVTNANRAQYVELYTDWLLSRSVEKQFNAFAHGFHQVGG
jgi:hypothetical protein